MSKKTALKLCAFSEARIINKYPGDSQLSWQHEYVIPLSQISYYRAWVPSEEPDEGTEQSFTFKRKCLQVCEPFIDSDVSDNHNKGLVPEMSRWEVSLHL